MPVRAPNISILCIQQNVKKDRKEESYFRVGSVVTLYMYGYYIEIRFIINGTAQQMVDNDDERGSLTDSLRRLDNYFC